MKKCKLLIVSLLSILYLFSSCTPELKTITSHSTINITTRSSNDEELYPLLIYIMNQDGDCISNLKAYCSDDPLRAELASGTYTIHAYSQADDNIWVFPTANNAKSNTSITPQATNRLNALGYGTSTITMNEDDEKCSIEFSHITCLLNLHISDVPKKTIGVSITMKPFSRSILLDGTPDSSKEEITWDLEQRENNNWELQNILTLPCSSKQATLTINIKDANNHISSYSIITESPKPNQQFNFYGKYRAEDSTISNSKNLTFALSIAPWNSFTIKKDFGPSIVQMPEIGQIWNDCVIMNIKNQTDNEADLLLMTINEWTNQSIEDASSLLKAYHINEISDWTLPTKEDITILSSARKSIGTSALNTLLVEGGGTPISGNAYYLGITADNNYLKYHFNGNIYEIGSTAKFRVRGITHYHYRANNK